MRTLGLLLTFYKSFAFTSLMITLSCLSIIYVWGLNTIVILFWFKIVTIGLISYYIHNFKKKDYYYYKNLGLSRITLWISTIVFDLCVFLILIILILNIR